MLSRNSKQRKRGVVLIITLFFMMILGLMAAAMFKIIPQEHLAIRRHLEDQQSHYAATSGVKDVLAWIVNVRAASNTASQSWSTPKEPFAVPAGQDYEVVTNINPGASPWRMDPIDSATPSNTATLGNVTNPITYFYNGMPVLKRTQSLQLSDGWCADVFVFPDKMTFPHQFALDHAGTATQAAAYCAVSVAYRDINGDGQLTPSIGEKYKLRAKANFSTDTLAKFAYFTDNWANDENGNPSAITLNSGLNRAIFDGPFHSNAAPHFFASGGNAYWNGSTPSFTSTLTFSDALTGNYNGLNHDGLAWEEGNMQSGANSVTGRPYDDSNNAIASRYQRMMQNGEPAIRNVKKIEMPTDSTPLAKAAWGEQSTITDQSLLPADGVYVNSLSTDPTKAAGGIFVKGNVQKMTLEVLNSTGAAVGDGNLNSTTPNPANDGNPAVRLTMSTSYNGTTAINPTVSTVTGGTQYLYNTQMTSASQTSNSQVSVPTSSVRIYNASSQVAYNANRTSNQTVNYTGQLTSNQTVNYTGTLTSNQTVNYQTTLTSNTSSQGSSFGTGAGAGTRIYYTVPYTVSYTGNASSQSQVSYQGPRTSTSQVTYNGPTSSQSQVSYTVPTTTTRTYSNSQATIPYTSNYNIPQFSGFGAPTPQYTVTGTQYGASQTFPTTQYQTQSFQPKALVIEANTTPMTLQASNLFAGGSPSMSFIVNGATQASLNVATNNAYTIQQNKQYPNLWEVKSLQMQSDVTTGAVSSNYHLNGAVHVNGNIGNTAPNGRAGENDNNFYSEGLSGWNKGKKTIAADKFDWTSPSASTVTPQQLRIDGHIRVFDTPQGSQISGTNLYKHNVGIMADTIDLKVTRAEFNGGSGVAPFNGASSKELFVYGVIMGRGNGMVASNVRSTGYGGGSNRTLQGSLKNAKLRLFGGLLQKVQGEVRVGSYGWDQEYNYDPQNAISPPPFFPTLNDFVIFNYIEDKV